MLSLRLLKTIPPRYAVAERVANRHTGKWTLLKTIPPRYAVAEWVTNRHTGKWTLLKTIPPRYAVAEQTCYYCICLCGVEYIYMPHCLYLSVWKQVSLHQSSSSQVSKIWEPGPHFGVCAPSPALELIYTWSGIITGPPSFNWHNYVNMRYICIKISDNIAEGMLNLKA